MTDINMRANPLVEDDAGTDANLPFQRGAALTHSSALEHILKPPGAPGGGHGGGGGGGGVPFTTEATTPTAGPSFDDVAALTGSYVIPPDSTSAAGTSGVVVAVNIELEEFDRSGATGLVTPGHAMTLDSVFSTATGFLGKAFDPRVMYDANTDRFIVVAVDQNSTNHTSQILVAVSTNGHPHGATDFTATAINASTAISGSWADFPQAAIDNAGHIYITSNMFAFSGGSFTGSRMWTVQESGLATSGPVNPTFQANVSGGDLFSLAPTDMSTAGGGTYLVSYDSATNAAGNNVLNIIHVSGATYTAASIDVGHIDQNLHFGGITAPQPGTSKTLDADDSRTALAVFQNGHLYVAATIVPVSGPDAGHATAHWWAFDTDANGNPTTLLNQGDISGNTFAAGSGLRTFYPSLAVGTANGHDELAISFSGSAPGTGTGYDGYPSAYEVTFDPTAHTTGNYQEIGGWHLLASGQASYVRTLGGGDNRWGDYSSISVDPLTHTDYWAFNEYAMPQGTSLLGENGRWGTELGLFS